MKKSKAKRESEKSRTKNARLIRHRALTGMVPYTIQEVISLNIQTGKEVGQHISKLFPLILELVSKEELSIPAIERLLHVRAKLLERFIYRHPSLTTYIRQARTLKLDSQDNSYLQ